MKNVKPTHRGHGNANGWQIIPPERPLFLNEHAPHRAMFGDRIVRRPAKDDSKSLRCRLAMTSCGKSSQIVVGLLFREWLGDIWFRRCGYQWCLIPKLNKLPGAFELSWGPLWAAFPRKQKNGTLGRET